MKQKWPKSMVWASWVVIIWGLGQSKTFLIPLLLAALISFLISPLIQLLEKKKFPEWASILMSSLVLFLPVVLLGGLLLNEGSILIRDYPQIAASTKAWISTLAESTLVRRFNLSEYLDIGSLTQSLSEDTGKSIATVLEGLKALLEASAHFIVVLVFSIIMLASRKNLRKSAEKLLGSRPRTLDDMIELIEKFLIIRIGIAGLVSFLDFMILKGFGSKYSVLFGVILGFSTFIPAVGFVLGILPPLVTAIALGHSIGHILGMVGLLYAVAFVEGHFVTPKYLGKQLNLNLLVTFVGLFGGELLWGVWGMVLSIPLLGIVRIILSTSEDYRPFSEMMAEKTS